MKLNPFELSSSGKKMSKVYLAWFAFMFLSMMIQILIGSVNIPLTFFGGCAILFLLSAFYTTKLKNELFEELLSYYRGDHRQAEQHLKFSYKMQTVKVWVGLFFLAVAAVCVRHSHESFGEIFAAARKPACVAGFFAVAIGAVLYSLTPKLCSENHSPKTVLFKISCVGVLIFGFFLLIFGS